MIETFGAGTNPRAAVGLLAALFLAGVGLGCRQAEQAVAPTPVQRALFAGVAPAQLNVVLVTIDTLRADRLSCYGSTQVKTPILDRIASEGVLFSNAASTVPFTLPAHSSIMTGTYPPWHGVRENVGFTLAEGTPTIAEELEASGRLTAGFVSAFVLDERWGIGRGFGHYFDDFDLDAMETANLSSVQRPGEETIAEAIRWLDAGQNDQPGTPFFLWLHLYDPHDPYTPPEPYKSEYPAHPYDGEVAYTDAILGRFIEALESRGVLDKSLLILTADHGEGLGDHKEAFHGYFVYETTIHVPLILRFPAAMHSGQVVDSAVSHVDLLPTILDAVQLPVPEGVHGTSLLPMITGQASGPEREVYSESFYPLLHYGWSPLRSIRTDRYKLIDVPRPELFDLTEDRGEANDLSGEELQVLAELEGRLDLLRPLIESDAPSDQKPGDLDQETIDRLRALGYMAGSGVVTVHEEDDRPRADPKDKIGLHQMIMAAQSRMGRGEVGASKRLLEKVLSQDSSIIDAHQMLGQIGSTEGEFAAAVEHFKRALALDENHQKSLFGLARSYKELGRFDEAVVGFRRLLDLSDRDIRATLALADIFTDTEELDQAVAVLQAALDQPEAPPFLFNRLGELRTLQGRGDEAAGLFEQAISSNQELAEPRFNLAVLREEAGDVHGAIRLYQEAIERAPRHYQAHFNLGRLYGQVGQADRQQRHWEAAIEHNPNFARGYYYLAKLLMDSGQDLARAEKLAREGLARDPDHLAGPLGYFLLADLLNRTGRPAEAQKAVARAREVDSRHTERPVREIAPGGR